MKEPNDRVKQATHDWVKQRLSAYIDGELPEWERIRLEHHLSECSECAWNLQSLRQTVHWLRQLPEQPVPRSFRIPESQAPASDSGRSWLFPFFRTATVLAAVLLAMVFSLDMFRQAFLFNGVALAPSQQTAVRTPDAMKAPSVVSPTAPLLEVPAYRRTDSFQLGTTSPQEAKGADNTAGEALPFLGGAAPPTPQEETVADRAVALTATPQAEKAKVEGEVANLAQEQPAPATQSALKKEAAAAKPSADQGVGQKPMPTQERPRQSAAVSAPAVAPLSPSGPLAAAPAPPASLPSEAPAATVTPSVMVSLAPTASPTPSQTASPVPTATQSASPTSSPTAGLAALGAEPATTLSPQSGYRYPEGTGARPGLSSWHIVEGGLLIVFLLSLGATVLLRKPFR